MAESPTGWTRNPDNTFTPPPQVLQNPPASNISVPEFLQYTTIKDGSLVVYDNTGLEVVRLGKQADGTYGIRIADTSTGTVNITTSGIIIKNAAGTTVIRLGRQTTGRYGLSSFDASGNRIIDLGELASSLQGLEVFNTAGVRQVRLGQLASGYGLEALDASGNTVTLEKLSFGLVAAQVQTSESTSTQTYTDLATVGPAVAATIGSSGRALVTIGARETMDSSEGCVMSFAISGATTVAASDNTAYVLASGAVTAGETFQIQGSGVYLVTGLNAGSNTFTAKYRASAGTVVFSFRHISVQAF